MATTTTTTKQRMLKKIRAKKNSWVMLSPSEGFTLLPGEQRLYTSPPRTALALQSLNKYPGKEPFNITSSAGCVHLTSRRIVYLPASPSDSLQSFAAPILNLHDTHVNAPFFGPNVWSAIVQPVPGGNIPSQHAALELKLTFKDGGAYDFSQGYERIKERMQQAIEVARESGNYHGSVDGSDNGSLRTGGPLAGVDLNTVHLEQLPAYEPPPPAGADVVIPDTSRDSGLGMNTPEGAPAPKPDDNYDPPSEPPPGYEEVQSQSVADELERRLRGPQS
ncbi:ww-domain-binding protein [Diplodia corticola]|uniref:Ww-domain-binding protein n=1 Tax=Diplodia corticola TaxID=236234 RepID=A0A1J9RJT7_9PEZI|nr:ww-domain-binding protein [Diplodia corticola]OJD40737.1 ww-domain-binding protein [Diplodia corticola]